MLKLRRLAGVILDVVVVSIEQLDRQRTERRRDSEEHHKAGKVAQCSKILVLVDDLDDFYRVVHINSFCPWLFMVLDSTGPAYEGFPAANPETPRSVVSKFYQRRLVGTA